MARHAGALGAQALLRAGLADAAVAVVRELRVPGVGDAVARRLHALDLVEVLPDVEEVALHPARGRRVVDLAALALLGLPDDVPGLLLEARQRLERREPRLR